MKFFGGYLSFFTEDPNVRQNTRLLLRYLLFLAGLVVAFSVLFHVIMYWHEGVRHSWITGFYWTLTVMSTLGLGDITFTTDLGRAFTLVVLVTGIITLLIVLPFAFIRFFYAPWLEAQIHRIAPRSLPEDTTGHVVICEYESIAETLIERFRQEKIPYVVVVDDPARAADLRNKSVAVMAGYLDNPQTYRNARVEHARLVLANHSDIVNTNIILTVREVTAEVPIVAIASSFDAVDVLSLSGATEVLPIRKRLGEHLANRVSATRAHSHIVGSFEGLLVAELPVRRTPLVGKTIRETQLRQITGLNIIAVWELGHVLSAHPDLRLTDHSVPVMLGTKEQFDQLDDLLLIYDQNPNPVLVIGAGRVGRSAARALKEKDIPVHIVERLPQMVERAKSVGVPVFLGDAEDYSVLMKAGIQEAPSVVLTTHDDAMNIYLASYCRRLNPELRIVSRITRERNIESIHRAGADFVLSYASLGAASIYASMGENQLLILGDGQSVFNVKVPPKLRGLSVAESEIGAKTGMVLVATRRNDAINTAVPPEYVLKEDEELIMLGDADQRRAFAETYQ